MDKAWFELKGIRPVMLLLAALSLLQGAAVITQAIFLAKAVTVLFNKNPLVMAWPSLALFFAAFAVRHTMIWLQRRTAGRFAEAAGASLRERLLARLFERGPGFAAQEGSGKLVTLALDGVDRFRNYLEISIPRIIDMMAVTLLVLVYVFTLDMISGVILTTTMPILVCFFILLGLAARKQADKQWRSYRLLSHHFTDSLRGLQTLRFLGRSRAHGETVGKVSDQYRTATMRTLRVAFLSSFALDFFSMLSVAFVAVGLGLRLISGSVGLEAALAVLILAPEYFMPIRQLGSDYHASLDGKEAWGAIRSILVAEDETIEPKTANDKGLDITGQDILKLSDVCFLNEDGSARLEHVSASAEPHMNMIGIVGASGAGKTTLLSLLGGFTDPTSGELILNGCRLSVDTKAEWQRHIAYIPQHPYLFSATLADNIRFYEPEASNQQVEWAIDAVGLRELVNGLPGGLDEPIGEAGRTLSGGQAQRIALARALLSNRPIILLDEPTAHLDIETEWELKQTILSVLKHKRMFLATHRLHWMPDMDCVWMMNQGRLEEVGSHQQLVAQKGEYYRLLTGMSEGGDGRYESNGQ
ncbi:thiol reductant ABC exporter subunit CydD [Paenibacillus polymyxa]|uniref:ABC transporter ATP-binding protein n=1 Tax=Paenibacillus polymyxa (strain SC2) TaxID=886882 RepID=E3EAD1_PAEPS|nr:thiol reductant ABC exporter subunit CydD [Paenibacillus polymyxa]ADO58549.1 ABC transporter ATP-binding protein [Paenibacillus polymyxa SC2]WPQ56190.1 thiol reductant ABC exporter subunit CydD [Paenibacillus polymyxa]CCI71107.1 Lipid A export ATP-binding/permease protein msbA [Paenibacillus polymyxa M1]